MYAGSAWSRHLFLSLNSDLAARTRFFISSNRAEVINKVSEPTLCECIIIVACVCVWMCGMGAPHAPIRPNRVSCVAPHAGRRKVS